MNTAPASIRSWIAGALLLSLIAAGSLRAQEDPQLDSAFDRVYELKLRDVDEAWRTLAAVRDRARTAADPEYWADWNLIAASIQVSRGNLTASLEHVDLGHALYQDIDSREGRVWASLVRGEVRSESARYLEAIADFEAVLANSDGLEDARSYDASAWMGIGNANAVIGNFVAALNALTKAYEIYSELGDEVALSGVYGLIGNVYSDIDATEQALLVYNRATEIDRELGDDLNVSINLYNTARAYTELGQTDKARELYRESAALAAKAGSGQTGAYATFGTGLSYMVDRDFVAARREFLAALAVFEATEDRFQIALTRHQLGVIDLAAGRVAEAEAAGLAALKILEEAGDEKHLVKVLDLIAEAKAAGGDFEGAYRFSDRGAELMARQASEERARRVAHLRVSFDTDRAEDEARVAGEEAQLKAELLAYEQAENRMILAAALLLLVALGALAWSFTKQKRLEHRLRHFANTDDLTGTLSRRRLFELGEREIQRAVRYGTPLSALLLDLDFFKTVNDRYGHATGDDVLAEFTARVAEALRETDLMGRIGGEEFLALLPGTGRDFAVEAADRLVQVVAALDLRSCGVDDQLTMSVGVTVFQGAGDTLVQMVKRADAALYEAKNQGRNRAWPDWKLGT